jgi:hypothetical protein
LDAEPEAKPGVDQGLVARWNGCRVPVRAGGEPAGGQRGVEIPHRLGARSSDAREIDDRPSVADRRIVGDVADEVRHDLVPAQSHHAVGALAVQLALNLRTEIRHLREQGLRRAVPRVAVAQERGSPVEVFVAERLDFDLRHRRRTIALPS